MVLSIIGALISITVVGIGIVGVVMASECRHETYYDHGFYDSYESYEDDYECINEVS